MVYYFYYLCLFCRLNYCNCFSYVCFNSLQQDAITETQSLQKNLENAENELNKTGDQYSHLQLSINSEHEANESLKQIIVKLEKELGEEKANSLNVQKTLSR